MKNFEQKVYQYLVSLGRGHKKISETLKKRRIKGVVFCPGQCPIASALKRRYKSFDVSVTDDKVYLDKGGKYYSVLLPKVVQRFVKKFDNLEYPELIEDN